MYFERVTHNLKYFDVVFICKDYETWVRIDSIPSKVRRLEFTIEAHCSLSSSAPVF